MDLKLSFCVFTSDSSIRAFSCCRHRGMCAQGICRYFCRTKSNSINYLLMFDAWAWNQTARTRSSSTIPTPNSIQSNIFRITYDYLHILKHSMNGNNTVSIHKCTVHTHGGLPPRRKNTFISREEICTNISDTHTHGLSFRIRKSQMQTQSRTKRFNVRCCCLRPNTFHSCQKKRKSEALVPHPHTRTHIQTDFIAPNYFHRPNKVSA